MNFSHPYVCLACHEEYSYIPTRCKCGDNVFLNLKFTIYSAEMYSEKEEKIEPKRIILKKDERDMDDYDYFNGFYPTPEEVETDMC